MVNVRSTRRYFFVGVLSLFCVALSACATPLSPADLEHNETHETPGHNKSQAHRATVTALRTLGYEVVVSERSGGENQDLWW